MTHAQLAKKCIDKGVLYQPLTDFRLKKTKTGEIVLQQKYRLEHDKAKHTFEIKWIDKETIYE